MNIITHHGAGIAKIAGLAGLLTLAACAASGNPPDVAGKQKGSLTGAMCSESDDGANDKILCTVDGDCDADEVCTNGRCAGLDGEAEDGAPDCAGAADEEEANDKITCAVDADCDADEVCTKGLCTGLDGEAEDDADEAAAGSDDEDQADDADDEGQADDADDEGQADDADDEGEADDEDDEGEEANDKIICAVDADCDADEVCTNGLCTGLDGDTE
jgi:hypothetical protein